MPRRPPPGSSHEDEEDEPTQLGEPLRGEPTETKLLERESDDDERTAPHTPPLQAALAKTRAAARERKAKGQAAPLPRTTSQGGREGGAHALPRPPNLSQT